MTSTVVVSVVQKQREIGILRAMGAGRRRIMAVFLLQGGLAGSVLGAALAAAVIPARRAARMDPVQAIRA